MGKLAKPQKSKKQKKIKAVDPFYVGNRKDVRQQGWNQKPRNFEQEIPKKLRLLGFSIDGVKSGRVGKKSRNKFLKHSDGPDEYNSLRKPLGTKLKPTITATNNEPSDATPESTGTKKKKKSKKPKLTEKDISNYIDNLTAPRPFTEPFTFKKKAHETGAQFMKRVNQETDRVLMKTRIDEQYEVSDEKKMLKLKSKTGMSDKKKERLKEKKKQKNLAEKEKKQEKYLDFGALQDKVEFGDVVHAPPVLSVRPKKAVLAGVDRPGLRMPELKAIMDSNLTDATNTGAENTGKGKIVRQVGKSVKRKSLSRIQRHIADSQREKFINAYRQLKQSSHSV